MIIARYLTRQIIAPTLGITAIIVAATMSNWLKTWLDDATGGQGASGELMVIILYYIPMFLQESLPVGFMMGILIAYGRLYSEYEMTSLLACGFRFRSLVGVTMIPATVLAVLMLGNNLWLSPTCQQIAAKAWARQESLTAFDLLTVGRFMEIGNSGQVLYVADLDNESSSMQNVFMSTDQETVFKAQEGEIRTDSDTGARYLVLKDGTQQSGEPGEDGYSVTYFEEYGVKIAEKQSRPKTKRESIPTSELIQSDLQEHKAELQWRLLTSLNFFIAVLLAVPLSRINPRQGKFLKIFPALMIYALFNMAQFNWARAVQKGDLPLEFGIFWLQGMVMLGCILWMTVPNMIRKWRAVR